MDNKLVTKDNPEVQAFFEELENLLNLISRSFENKESDIKKLLESNRMEAFRK